MPPLLPNERCGSYDQTGRRAGDGTGHSNSRDRRTGGDEARGGGGARSRARPDPPPPQRYRRQLHRRLLPHRPYPAPRCRSRPATRARARSSRSARVSANSSRATGSPMPASLGGYAERAHRRREVPWSSCLTASSDETARGDDAEGADGAIPAAPHLQGAAPGTPSCSTPRRAASASSPANGRSISAPRSSARSARPTRRNSPCANGCDHVILYRDEDFAARVKEITGGAALRRRLRRRRQGDLSRPPSTA